MSVSGRTPPDLICGATSTKRSAGRLVDTLDEISRRARNNRRRRFRSIVSELAIFLLAPDPHAFDRVVLWRRELARAAGLGELQARSASSWSDGRALGVRAAAGARCGKLRSDTLAGPVVRFPARDSEMARY